MEKRLSLVIDASKAKSGATDAVRETSKVEKGANKATSAYERLSQSVLGVNSALGSLGGNNGKVSTSFDRLKGTVIGANDSLLKVLGTSKSTIKELNSATSSINKSFSVASTGLRNLRTSVDDTKNKFATLRSDITQTSNTLNTLQKTATSSANKLSTSFGNLSTGIGGTTIKFTALRSEVGTLTGRVSSLDGHVKLVRDSFKTLNTPLNRSSKLLDSMNLKAIDAAYAFGEVNKAARSTSVNLNGMSGKLDRASNSTVRFREQMVKAQKDFTSLTSTVRKLQDQIDRTDSKMKGFGNSFTELGRAARSMTDAFDRAIKRQEKLESQLDRTRDSMTRVTRGTRSLSSEMLTLGTAITGVSFVMILQELGRTTDAYKNLQNRIAVVTGSTEGMEQVTRKLLQVSQESRTSIDATADVYAKITRVNKQYGLSQEELLDVTTAVSQAVSMSGATAQGAQGAMIQFAQALQNNFAAAAQEMNSIIEQTPALAELIADAMNAVEGVTTYTMGNVKKAATEGMLDVKKVLEGILLVSDDYAKRFELSQLLLSQGWIQIKNSLTVYLGELDKATGITKSLADGMMELAKNFDDYEAALWGAGAALTALMAITTSAGFAAIGAMLGVTGLIVAGIAAIIGGLTYLGVKLYKLMSDVEEFGRKFDEVVISASESIVDLFANKMYLSVSDGLEDSQGAFNGFMVWHRDFWYNIYLFFEDIVDSMAKFFRETFAGQLMSKTFDIMRRTVAAGMLGVVDAMIREFIWGLNYMGATVAQWANDLAKTLDLDVRVGWSGISGVTVVSELLENEKNAVSALKEELGTLIESRKESIKLEREEVELNKILDDTLEGILAINEEFNTSKSESTKQSSKYITSLNMELEWLIKETAALKLGSEAYKQFAIDKAVAEGVAANPKDDPQVIAEKIGLIHKEREAVELLKQANEDYTSFMESSSTFELGDIFGESSKSLETMVASMETLADVAKEYEKAMKKQGKTEKELNDLNKKRFQLNLNGYADMSASAKGFFKDQSKEYKALEAIETGFRIAEMALAAESYAVQLMGMAQVVSSAVSSTAVEMGLITARTTAKGVEAVATQAAGGDPYTAFGRVAAMVGLLAGFGILVGGGSSGGDVNISEERQRTQGTGSVLGDATAKSDSIAKSTELMTVLQQSLLDVNKDMLKSLQSLSISINSFGQLIVRQAKGLDINIDTGTSFEGIAKTLNNAFQDVFKHMELVRKIPIIGDILGGGLDFTSGLFDTVLGGLFGKTTVSIADEGVGIMAQSISDIVSDGIAQSYAFATAKIKKKSWFSSSTKYKTIKEELPSEISQQFSLVMLEMFDSISAGITGLFGEGSSQQAALMEATIEDTMISLRGLSGEDQLKELEAVFSNISDTLTTQAIPELSRFAKTGEGAFQTLARLSAQVSIFRAIADKVGLSVKYIGFELIEFVDGLADKVGGVEEMANKTNSLFELMMTDQEKLGFLFNRLSTEFSEFGKGIPLTTDALKELVASVEGIDGELDQDLLATILNNVEDLDSFIKSMDSNFSSYLDNFYSEEERFRIFAAELAGTFRGLGVDLPTTVDGFRDLVDGIDMTTEDGKLLYSTLVSLNPEVKQFIDGMSEFGTLLNGLKSAAEAALNDVKDAVDAQKKLLQERWESERKGILDAITAKKLELSLIDDQIDALNGLKTLVDLLKSTVDSMKMTGIVSTGVRRQESQSFLGQALTNARNGQFVTADELRPYLSALQEPSEGLFGSFEDYARDFYVTKNTVDALREEAESSLNTQMTELDVAKKALENDIDSYNRQLELIDKQYNQSIDALDKQLAEAQALYDEVVGIGDAIENGNNAIIEALNQLKEVLGQLSTTQQVSDLYQSILGREGEDAGLSYYEDKVTSGDYTLNDVANEMSNSIEKALQDAYIQNLGREADKAGLDWYHNAISSGDKTLDEVIADLAYQGTLQKPKGFLNGGNHDGGWMMAGEIGPELVYSSPSRVYSNRDTSNMFDMSEVITEIRNMREELKAANLAIARNTHKIAKVVDRWEGDGLPPERTT